MSRYYYDFHVHSCLSPCGDADNTPNNLAGMAFLNGIRIMALTDHNSSRNCPAFFAAARKYGLIPIAGMELTTAEDIHVVCLFEELENALRFNDEVDTRRIRIRNRTDIFGDQLLTDENDNVIGTEEDFLSNATEIAIGDVPALVERFGGFCFPAHIDREANGIIATLGTFPENSGFTCAELHDPEKETEYRERYPALAGMRIVGDSDAHYLWDIRDKTCFAELPDEPYSGAFVRKQLFRWLRGELT